MGGLEFAKAVLEGEAWLPTPLLPAQSLGRRLGIELWLKREDCTPIGSFKLRGALVAAARLAGGLSDAGVYAASAGNYGRAVAMAGQRHGIKVTVVVPQGATPSKIDRIRTGGAQVVVYGEDFDEAKEFARVTASDTGAEFWEDGVLEEMALGAATIATELLDHPGRWDRVLVPVGNGSLIKGVASVFKDRSPDTVVTGLVSTGAPSMAYAIQGRRWDEETAVQTVADGLSVRVPIRAIVEEIRPIVSDMWLVDEQRLLPAVKTLMEVEQVMVEPSAAITVAGLVEHRAELEGARVAAILTGAHLRPSLFTEVARSESLLPTS